MRRRDLLRSLGSGVVILTVASGKAIATVENQREAAIDHASDELGVAKEHLEVLVESVAKWSTIGEEYYQAKVHDSKHQRMHRVLLDGNGEEVNRDQLHKREEQAYRDKYGKFTPEFADELENADADDKFQAQVRLKSDSLDRREPVRRTVDNTEDRGRFDHKLKEKLSNIRTDIIQQATSQLANDLSDLSSTEIQTKGTGTATVAVESTKEDLQQAANRSDVWRIFEYGNKKVSPGQDSATHTIDASDSEGPLYDVSDGRIGVLEGFRPSEYVEANIAGSRFQNDWDQHATMVIECAASSDETRPGTAHNAAVYAADNFGNEPFDNFVSFFDRSDVAAFNCSWSHIGSDCVREMIQEDLNAEESTFNHNMCWVQIAGNEGQGDADECQDLDVLSPGKAFNAITVGSIFDNNTGGDDSDDSISDFSCRVNPFSRNQNPDRDYYPNQKPEVSAVGESIDTPYNTFEGDDSNDEVVQVLEESEDGYHTTQGTSFAGPDVAGMVTIFEDYYGGIAAAPDTAKAVAMASARHDLGDYTRGEHGAGCINVASGQRILREDQFITDTFDESNKAQDYSISLEAGDTVDIVLVWRSDATQANFSDPENAQSDINLDLNFYDPDGNIIAFNGDYDRAWQFIEGGDDNLSADIDETGNYGIKIWNDRWDADSSHREFTIAWRIY